MLLLVWLNYSVTMGKARDPTVNQLSEVEKEIIPYGHRLNTSELSHQGTLKS